MFRQRTKQTIKENFVCLFGRSSGTVFTSGISRAFFEYLNSNVYQKIGRRQVTTCSRIKGKTCGISPPIYGQIEVENFSKQKKRQEKGKPGHVVQIRLLCVRGITFTANGRFKLRISPNRRYKQIKISRTILMDKTGLKLLIFLSRSNKQ